MESTQDRIKFILQQFCPVSDTTVHLIVPYLEKIQVKDKELIIKANIKCKYVYFINSGLVRSYYTGDGKEHTTWFGVEGDFVTSFYSMFTDQNGYENIQMLENSELFRLKMEDFKKLVKENVELNQFYIKVLELGYIYWEKRFMLLQIHSAKDRYHHFMETNKKAGVKIPLGILASYLGITQETLSRIRSEY